jgi:hypothetical protein
MVTLAQVNFFILTDTFNMCHPSYESMSRLFPLDAHRPGCAHRGSLGGAGIPDFTSVGALASA